MQTISYKTFVEAIDRACYTRLGCSVHDLPDYPIRDSWDELEEELALADFAERDKLFINYVSYVIDDLEVENINDANPFIQGVHY
tara:strand:+ start:125 stop:379 length:255 start_codon:yes stop_codon:yes gene_type:complete